MATHNQSRTKLYGVWKSMRARCHNPHHAAYARYGGRGIKVCDSWRTDFAVFAEWSKRNGYTDGMTIDRIDNDKGYSPDNCRWVNMITQQRNRCNNHFLEYHGMNKTIAEWSEITGISNNVLKHRIYMGWDVEKALKMPVIKRRRAI